MSAASKKIPQPRDFNDMFRRQDRANQIRLRSSVDFIQMMLRFGLRHELPDALVESAVNDQVRTCAEGGANAFTVDRWPFSESCGSIEINFDLSVGHPWRLAPLSQQLFVGLRITAARGTVSEIGKA